MSRTPHSRSTCSLHRVLVAALALLVSGVAATAAGPAGASTDPATGFAGTELPADAVTVHVDATAPMEGVNGTAAHPFPTLHWAMAAVGGARSQGYAIRIVIAPGTYRESLTVGYSGANPPPLVIEPEIPGTVTISGADVEARWAPVPDRPGVVAAPWDKDWGLSALPDWGGAEVHVAEGARRRENVLIGGVPQRQVLSADALTPGSFYVDEGGDRLLLAPPDDVTRLQDHVVEVARRPSILRIDRTRDVTIRGITFETGAPAFENHMAYVTNSADILVEGSTFRHSSWHGLGFSGVGRVTVRDSHFVDNGGNGINTNAVTDVVITSNEISRNNVRGAAHGWIGWSVAGSKNLRLAKAVFRDNSYIDNRARGLWLDTDIQHVLVEGERASGNYKDGILIEAAQGPVTVRNGTYVRNWGAGVALGANAGVTVHGTTMANNALSQLFFEHDRVRTFTDRVTRQEVTLRDFAGLTLVENTFVSDGSSPVGYSPLVGTRWIPITDWRTLLGNGEITAARNTWLHSQPAVPFWIKGDTSFTLTEWSLLTGDGGEEATEPAPKPTSRGNSGKQAEGGDSLGTSGWGSTTSKGRQTRS